jgi:NTE family protein
MMTQFKAHKKITMKTHPASLSRRQFLASSVAAVVSTAVSPVSGKGNAAQSAAKTGMSIGLALGSGGASGLAHIPMLEVLDELGMKPEVIAGTSIGAIIGAMYASGLSGEKLRGIINDLHSPNAHIMQSLITGKAGLGLFDLLRTDINSGGLLDSQGFLDFVQEKIGCSTFEELPIRLKIVAADYWRREQVVFEKGLLLPAIKASMAVPGLFAPTRHNDKLLVDGGTVNPLPYDLIRKECELLLAVDVSGSKTEPVDEKLDVLDVIFNTFEIMQQAITTEKMKTSQPDIYIRPDISGVRLLHFNKAEYVFKRSANAAAELKDALRSRL